MYDRNGNYLIVAILIGMILGVVVTAIFGEGAVHVKFLGDIFLNALKMIVIPLLFCSMIVGITNLGDIRKLGRTGVKTLIYFLATSAIAVVLGLILVNIVRPGVGYSAITGTLPEAVGAPTSYSFFTWLTNQIPANIFKAAAETQVLPIIVVALFFGGVLTTIGAKGKPIIAFFDGINDVLMKIVHIIMWFAPIGIFGLVAGQLASEGGLGAFSSVLSALGKYVAVVLIGLLIHGVVILPLILKFFAGKSPSEYFVGMSQALMTAFATASSSATLPVTMECAEEKNDVDTRASSFVLPLGATINMDGTALYEAVAAMFIAQAYGIGLPIWSQITIFATAILASVGAAGIPQAGLVTMILVLQAVGLPLEGIGLILAIDWFLDRCRTTVNVWGDSIGAAVIATTAEIALVERRPRPTRDRDRDRPSRFKGFSRRKQGREDRKPTDKTTGKPQTRTVSRRSDEAVGKGDSRRQQRRSKHKERPRNDRSRVERRDIKTVPPAPREEYKPKGAPAAEEAKKEPEKTPKSQPAQQAPQPLSHDDRKQGYGRKRRRPPHGRGKAGEADGRRESSSGRSTEKSAEAATSGQKERDFEMPKFPEKILDELSSRNKDDESAAKMRVSDRADLYDYGIHTRDLKVSEDEGEKATSPETPKTEEAVSPAVSDEETVSEEASPDEAFARLDEAVLGVNRKRTSESPVGEGETANEEEKAEPPEELETREPELSEEEPNREEREFSPGEETPATPSSSETEEAPGESVPAFVSSHDNKETEIKTAEPQSESEFESKRESEPELKPEPEPEPEPELEPEPEPEPKSLPEAADESEEIERPETEEEKSEVEEEKSEAEEDEHDLWGRNKRRKISR